MTSQSNLPDGAGKGTFPDPVSHKFEFTGNAGEMVPIILKNLLFNILTLSLYRFWGRTNIRRYLWENIRFMGDPLEYTGTGGELFKGFLIVLVTVFLPLFGLIVWGQLLVAKGNMLGMVLIFATYIFLIWLFSFGLYKAFKYRMSRTRWRGIRGAQLKSGAGFATEALSYTIFTGLTLGLVLPLMDNKLWSIETNNRRFGTGRFRYKAGSGPLYGGFFLSALCAIIGTTLVSFLFGGAIATSAEALLNSKAGSASVGLLFLWYLAVLLVFGLSFSIYMTTKLRHFWNNSQFEGATFNFSGKVVDLIALMVGNILITLLTLGIAYPVAQMRVVRFMTEHLSLEGDLDLARISQTTEAAPGFGEGLAEGFDMGTI